MRNVAFTLKIIVVEQKIRMKYSRLCAYFQAIIKMKKKKRQTIFTVCRLVSERGDLYK